MSLADTLKGFADDALEELGSLAGDAVETARTRTIEELPFEGTLYQYLPPQSNPDGTIAMRGEYLITPRGYQTLLVVAGVAVLFMATRGR